MSGFEMPDFLSSFGKESLSIKPSPLPRLAEEQKNELAALHATI